MKNLVPYKRFLNDKQDNIYFHFYNFITDDYLYKVSEEYLKIKNYKIGSNKDYVPIEKTEHTRKKTFVFPFTGNITKILNNYLMNVYKQQKIVNDCVEKKLTLSKLQSSIWEKSNSQQESFSLSDFDDDTFAKLIEKDSDFESDTETYRMK